MIHRPGQIAVFRPTAVAVAVAVTLGAGSVSAEPDADTERSSLERITITGDQHRIRELPGSAQVLDREHMDRIGSTDPNRILRDVPGVNVLEEEGFGLFPSISMRGTPPERNNRITVMEDGVPMAPAPYSAAAAYYFPPMGRMERVEVRKGSSSIRFGPYTTGGALNLVSTPIPRELSGKARTSYGTFKGQRHHLHVGDSSGQWGWLLEGFDQRSDGFKDLDNALSGPNNPEPDTGFHQRNLGGKLRWETAPETPTYQAVEFKFYKDDRSANETYLGLTEGDFDSDPFRRYAGSQLDEINTEHELYHLQHYIAPAANTDITTDVYYADFSRNWYKLHEVAGDGNNFIGITPILQNPEDFADEMNWIRGNTAALGADGESADAIGNVRANNREYYNRGIQTEITHMFAAGGWEHDLLVGVRYHQDEEDRLQWQDPFRMENGRMVLDVDPDDRPEPGSTTNRVTEASATAYWIQNTMRQGAWTITPGVRIEDITIKRTDFIEGSDPTRSETDRVRRNDTTEIIPGIGATYDLDDHWTLLSGVHRGFAPSGSDPDVDNERSVNYEAGFRYNSRVTRAEVIAFFNDYENIAAECTAVGGGGCEIGDTFAGGAVDIYGLEALYLHDLGVARNWDYSVPLAIGYTFTDSKFKSDFGGTGPNNWEDAEKGDRLPEIPRHALNVGVGIQRPSEWSVNLDANYISSAQARAGSENSDQEIESRLLLDLGASYTLSPNAKLFGSIENLTDNEYTAHFRPAGQRPGAPRTLWAGLEISF